MTPGSAMAWTEKQTVTRAASQSARSAAGAAPSDTDDIGKILGRMMANQHGPSPFGARDANSPNAGVMCRPGHKVNVCPAAALVKPRRHPAPHPAALPERIETGRGPVPG